MEPRHPAFADTDALLAAWGAGYALTAHQPPTGTINATLLLETPAGAFVLRAYLRADAATILREHHLIAHAAARGAPAVAPLPLPDGATFLERAGLLYALFPRARGQQLARGELGSAAATAMGRGLAELHAALADAPFHLARARSFEHDTPATLATIARYLELARGDELLVRHLEGQRGYLEAGGDHGSSLDGLPRQVIHGDYTETNLFFADGRVSAVIDWENNYVAPRAWEVLRTLHLAFDFEPVRCQAFVAGYRECEPLTLDELDQAAAAYGQMRAHDLWIFEAVLVRGDPRPRRFLDPAGFRPVLPRWATLRPLLPPS